MCFAEFLPCARYQNQVQHCDDTCDDVGYVQRQTKTDGLAQQEGRNDEDIECTRQQRDQECVFRRAFLCTQVNCDCCEGKYCDCLVSLPNLLASCSSTGNSRMLLHIDEIWDQALRWVSMHNHDGYWYV